MISAKSFIRVAQEYGFDFYSGVPCSYLKPFINYVIDSNDLTYIGAANEGDAVAMASGAYLAGRNGIAMFQNSGFGNAVSPLTSLNMIFNIPILIITTHRGEPGGPQDEPQHALMGQMTDSLFSIMKIPYETFPKEESEIRPSLDRAIRHMKKTGQPYGLIMKKGSVESYSLNSKPEKKTITDIPLKTLAPTQSISREKVLETIINNTSLDNDILIATTGFTGRCLYSIKDRANQLYMVGSMGCAPTLGLGLALHKPNKRVIVIDGDGAALMRLSAYATLGYERPKNMVHILIDNEVHDSTGGQSTVSHSMDLAGVAAACGYPKVIRAIDGIEIESILKNETKELTFVHIKTSLTDSSSLPRPSIKPYEVKERLIKHIAKK